MKPFEKTKTVIRGGILALAAVSLLAVPGCKRGDDVSDPGPPTGPSGKTYFITITASPSVLPSATNATSTITAVLRKYDGSGVANQSLRFEITDGFNTISVGSLSTKNQTTDTSGVARTTYTVPQTDIETYVWIRATWTTAPWTEEFWSTIPVSLRFKDGPPITNEYPLASFTIVTPSPYDVKQEITFDGKNSVDPDGVIIKYVWDFGDKQAVTSFETMENASPALNQPIVTHKYQLAGSYVVTLKVIDNLGAYDVDQQVILVGTLSGTAPTATYTIVTVGPYLPEQVITFDGTLSSDPDGAIRRWDWDWGDGKFTYNGGRIVTHSWKEVGQYPVTLTVTDDSGLKGIFSQNLLIGGTGTAPTASFFFTPTNPSKGQQVVFDASASSDSDGVVRSYYWTWGDGGHDTQSVPQAYHTYGNDGNYFVLLTVTDDDGLQGISTATVPVGGAADVNAPTACFVFVTGDGITTAPGPIDVFVGERIKYDASCSGDSDDTPPGIIMTWTWMFGDGTVEHGSIVTHAYAAVGIYNVFLTVMDDEGLNDVTAGQVSVSAGDPPVANAGADQSFTALACPLVKLVSFSGSSSTDSDGFVVSYTWDFGDGSPTVTAGTPSVVHSYTVTADVTYTVTLTVTDDDGLTDVDTVTVLLDCT